MKKINTFEIIKDAFTEPLPIGEKWYEQRLSICAGCDYNSANSGTKGVLNNLIKLAAEAVNLVDVNEPQCNACGCFISRKAGRKEEECGIVEKGLIPKWNRLMVNTVNETDFNLFNNSPEKINIDLSPTGDMYVVDYGTVNQSTNTSIQLLLEGTPKIISITSSCGCTTPTFKSLSENLWEINVTVKLDKVSIGAFAKKVYIYYNINGIKKTVEIKLKGIKVK